MFSVLAWIKPSETWSDLRTDYFAKEDGLATSWVSFQFELSHE